MRGLYRAVLEPARRWSLVRDRRRRHRVRVGHGWRGCASRLLCPGSSTAVGVDPDPARASEVESPSAPSMASTVVTVEHRTSRANGRGRGRAQWHRWGRRLARVLAGFGGRDRGERTLEGSSDVRRPGRSGRHRTMNWSDDRADRPSAILGGDAHPPAGLPVVAGLGPTTSATTSCRLDTGDWWQGTGAVARHVRR